MLDRVLGRAELKSRIEELEGRLDALREERADLEDRFEAEQRRRREATREKQEAEEEVNRLEDRIAQLEGTVDRLQSDEFHLEYRDRERLQWRETASVLDRLDSVEAGSEGALTAVVPDGSDLAKDVSEAFGRRATLVSRAAPCVAVTDDRGLVSATLSPPVLPEAATTWGDGFAIDRENFVPQGSFALALVRSDLFALGEYRGDERVSYRGFESDVKGDHSKGGFSQGRFERRRDEQIDRHLGRCEDAIADAAADRLFVVGESGALDALEVDADATAAVDATGKPEEALDDAFRDFWTTTLCLI